ncbi:helix-turn-helix domain-containing protein [Clostridium botulinum]|nr:helix-turn-helix domain-containing protein [Clostridium botulinum]NFR89940.1 helix-turn-helix domain-containing protein [Clostridium botulinum]NFT97928.1 helix-turn-helix domain-containing protein [Clostridium botulinum]
MKELRKLKGLTQEELANKCGLSKNGLWNYENNKRNPNTEILERIAKVLGVPLYKLIVNEKVNEIKKLEEVCKPVVDYLKKNWDPHCTVVITDSQIRLVRDEIGIPIGTAQEVPVQEQYVGKCNYCNKNNEIQSSIGIVPKFCMECGKSILYQKSHSL